MLKWCQSVVMYNCVYHRVVHLIENVLLMMTRLWRSLTRRMTFFGDLSYRRIWPICGPRNHGNEAVLLDLLFRVSNTGAKDKGVGDDLEHMSLSVFHFEFWLECLESKLRSSAWPCEPHPTPTKQTITIYT